jgi:very-short-patch-repair endonuclease
MSKSALEESLLLQMLAYNLPSPHREYPFAQLLGRRWRADFAYPAPIMLLIEVEGGTYSGGRHTTGSGYRKDAEKYNTASLMGYTVLRFTGDMVKDGTAIKTIKQALDAKGVA